MTMKIDTSIGLCTTKLPIHIVTYLRPSIGDFDMCYNAIEDIL